MKIKSQAVIVVSLVEGPPGGQDTLHFSSFGHPKMEGDTEAICDQLVKAMAGMMEFAVDPKNRDKLAEMAKHVEPSGTGEG